LRFRNIYRIFHPCGPIPLISKISVGNIPEFN